MGSWSVSCGISNIAITSGNKCVLLPLKKSRGRETQKWQAATLPIFGQYNDYGGIEEIEKDDNTELIEKHFGVSIDDFAVFLVDGKFTYDRGEAKEVAKRIEKFDESKLKEIEEWRFMWIDRQVYDFMIINKDKWHKGVLDYGTPEMLKLLGFEFVKKSDSFKNYDPKRFNQLWKKGDFEIFSDGRLMLKDDHYVYSFGKGNETSIETYFEVPKELEYLKEKSKAEAWRLLSDSDAKEELGWAMADRYAFDRFDDLLGKLSLQKMPLFKKYYSDLERFGDRIANIIILHQNLYVMSGQLSPHVLYLTPQCGEHKKHQEILEKFAEINKTYLEGYEDDEDE